MITLIQYGRPFFIDSRFLFSAARLCMALISSQVVLEYLLGMERTSIIDLLGTQCHGSWTVS